MTTPESVRKAFHLTENIVHLVLARTPGSPAGNRGISLFVVPHRHVAVDGAIGERNAVRCTSSGGKDAAAQTSATDLP